MSRKVGELRLFPALRAEAADTIVAATGVSCRQQIGHFAERTARHPVELVAEAVRSG
jgi:Fe-S oxidoreductase